VQAKLFAIVALGDLCLTAERAFHPYVDSVLEQLRLAAHQSMSVGKDEDEEKTMQSLRAALIDCYISVIHGLHEVEEENLGN
jgi:hypothetical protein